jgi:hypothetical protein
MNSPNIVQSMRCVYICLNACVCVCISVCVHLSACTSTREKKKTRRGGGGKERERERKRERGRERGLILKSTSVKEMGEKNNKKGPNCSIYYISMCSERRVRTFMTILH